MQQIFNATNDLTEQDQAQFKYNQLWSNRSRQEAELERAKSLRRVLWLAIRDLMLWMITLLVFAVALVIGFGV